MTLEKLVVIPLFPTVLTLTNIERPFLKEELEVVKNKKREALHPNKNRKLENNYQASDTFILEDPKMKSIKDFCELSLKVYWKEIIKAKEGSLPTITQSWLNYNEKGKAHHLHHHMNSILSGVFYFSDENQGITFHTPNQPRWYFSPTERNIYNGETYTLEVRAGDCIIFPSHLQHMVEPNTQEHTRVSLAFNVLPTGILGDIPSLSYAQLSVANERRTL